MTDSFSSHMPTLKGKTLFITGGSRGIGQAIALRAARDGANVVIAAKTSEPHPSLPGTIHSVAQQIRDAGGQALPLAVDIRKEDEIAKAVEQAVSRFGGIDVLVNNASALYLANVAETPMKRFDLMFDINVRGTFATTQACLPHLARAVNPHVLVLSPPLKLKAQWFGDHCAYTTSKYAMSMCVLGMAEDFRNLGISVNALWPRTMIQTAASGVIGVPAEGCRSVDIMSDAAYVLMTRDSRSRTGRFYLDEEVLGEEGITDFERYAVVPGTPPAKDLFVE